MERKGGDGRSYRWLGVVRFSFIVENHLFTGDKHAAVHGRVPRHAGRLQQAAVA